MRPLVGYSLAWSHEANSISLSDYIYFSSQLLFSIEEEWQECQGVEQWERLSYKAPLSIQKDRLFSACKWISLS